MKIDNVDVKEIVKTKGGFTIADLKEFAMWPVEVKPAHLTISIRDTDERNRIMMARMAIMAVAKGKAIIEIDHDAFSTDELDELTELVEETIIGSRVYMARGKGIIMLDRVFA